MVEEETSNFLLGFHNPYWDGIQKKSPSTKKNGGKKNVTNKRAKTKVSKTVKH